MAAELVATRPIAHRGLHDKAAGIIENTRPAFEAAIAGRYAIECDVQASRDGEAIVFHDETLDRLTAAVGRLDAHDANQLLRTAFKAGSAGMMRLADLLTLVAGCVPLIIEVKSEFDGRTALVERAAGLVASYSGPVALMSFDPTIVAWLRLHAPRLVRGIVAESTYDHAGWSAMPPAMKHDLANLVHFPATEPHFLSWRVADLPNASTVLYRHALARPVISWTVRTAEDRTHSLRHADQMTFEGFLP